MRHFNYLLISLCAFPKWFVFSASFFSPFSPTLSHSLSLSLKIASICPIFWTIFNVFFLIYFRVLFYQLVPSINHNLPLMTLNTTLLKVIPDH